jgi:hypothetical protein
VWFEDGSNNRLSFIQRYILRNAEEEENLFIWQNSVGGIDSVSFRASNEDDKQLEHQTLQNGDDSYEEYYVDYRKRAIKQLCGYVTKEEARWIDDFFFSKKRYRVEADGAVKAIVFVESKNVKQSENDLEEGYGFTYRLASDSDLLNLDRTFDPLPAPEVPVDFF